MSRTVTYRRRGLRATLPLTRAAKRWHRRHARHEGRRLVWRELEAA